MIPGERSHVIVFNRSFTAQSRKLILKSHQKIVIVLDWYNMIFKNISPLLGQFTGTINSMKLKSVNLTIFCSCLWHKCCQNFVLLLKI